MKITDLGVLEPSLMDFILPSDFAKQALYYAPQFGHFYCDSHYKIDRQFVDLYLLVYVCDGELNVNSRGQHIIAKRDQIVLFDCRHPHIYSCPSHANLLWFHFDGNSSQHYVNKLYQQHGILFDGEHIHRLKKYFELILSCSRQIIVNEHQISVYIHSVLSGLATSGLNTVQTVSALLPVFQYIQNHYHETIELEQLAQRSNLSVSHLIRTFRKHTHSTPHEYLLSYRLRQAKHLLLTTSMTIERIAEKCGFNSASHFARAFRHSHDITPTQFRKRYIIA